MESCGGAPVSNAARQPVSDVGLTPWVFNLYIDPKEQYPVGHRMNAWMASLAAEMKAYAATFKKYPAKNIGLGQ